MSQPQADATQATRWNSRVVVFALTATLGTTYMAGFNVFIPLVADTFHSSVPVVGQITTAMFFVGALSGVVIGPLADHYGHRRFIMAGALLVMIGSLGTAFAPSVPALFVVRILTAMSGGMLSGVTLGAVATFFAGDERRKAMSWVVAGIAGGPIVGIPFLTLIASVSSWRGAFVVLAALSVPIMLLQRIHIPPTQADKRGEQFRLRDLLTAYSPLIEHRPTVILCLSHLLRSITWIGILTYASAFFFDTYALRERGMGWVMMVAGAGYFTGSLLVGGRVGKFPLRTVYAISTTLLGSCMLLAVLVPAHIALTTGFFTAAAIFGGTSYTCQTTLLATTSAVGKATTMSFNSVFFGIGSAGGGAIGGALIAVGGYSALALGLAGFAVIAAAIVVMPSHVDAADMSIGRAS